MPNPLHVAVVVFLFVGLRVVAALISRTNRCNGPFALTKGAASPVALARESVGQDLQRAGSRQISMSRKR